MDFSQAHSFNLDDVGLSPDDPRSYNAYVEEPVPPCKLDPKRVHIPSGVGDDLAGQCLRYERMIEEAGGIDPQVLGIGRNGHIGFNDPGRPSTPAPVWSISPSRWCL